jgi:hypothetical protein
MRALHWSRSQWWREVIFFVFHVGQWARTVRAPCSTISSQQGDCASRFHRSTLAAIFSLCSARWLQNVHSLLVFIAARGWAAESWLKSWRVALARKWCAPLFCSSQFVWHPLETMRCSGYGCVLLRVYTFCADSRALNTNGLQIMWKSAHMCLLFYFQKQPLSSPRSFQCRKT